ncbi:MAG TPA: alpha-xylosidase, partial [Candidatus Limnocylindria bacterium]|nr:alpha-xylosidase [Candidatus Limnocylindria bacterium]
GIPLMRPMALEFPEDPACEDLDRQYMLGSSLLAAPVFNESGEVTYYLPKGKWTHLLSGETVRGGGWRTEAYGNDSLPLFVRENTLLPFGGTEDCPVYDYAAGLTLRAYHVTTGCETRVFGTDGRLLLMARADMEGSMARVRVEGEHPGVLLEAHGGGAVGRAEIRAGEGDCLL